MNGRLRGFAALAMTALVTWGCACTAPAGDTFHDAMITASVKMALAVKPGVAATAINVDTDRSVVTLRGEVRTEAERQLATMVAEDVGGVTGVVNRLQVGG